MPVNPEEWLQISRRFNEKWNYPHCIGAMGGKHVILKSQIHRGSTFSHDTTFSIVLFAVVDADYCFLHADVSCQGPMSDGGAFKNTALFESLENGSLNLPHLRPLEGRRKPMPYVFVADDAFAMHENIMRPYAGTQEEGSIKSHFNHRLSRARQTVENVFGMMSAAFRVLRKPLTLQPHTSQLVVLVCVYLHNYLGTSSSSRRLYTPDGSFDREENGNIARGIWRNEEQMTSMIPIPRIPRKPSTTCQLIRDEFSEYFGTIRKVSGQHNEV